MDKKEVKLKSEEKKLKQDIKDEQVKLKNKEEPKVLVFNDVVSGIGVRKPLFFKKNLEIKSEDQRTAFHDSIDSVINNYPELKGNHIKKVINTFETLINSEYKVSRKAYKDRDERYNNFKIIYYVSDQFTKYWAVRNAKGEKDAYKKVLDWAKDTLLIKNVWLHINSRASKKSKLKFVDLFKKSMKNTLKKIK